jgi:hypothetical protein
MTPTLKMETVLFIIAAVRTSGVNWLGLQADY